MLLGNHTRAHVSPHPLTDNVVQIKWGRGQGTRDIAAKYTSSLMFGKDLKFELA